MAWETSLDRLLLQQIHLAEKGEVKPELVRQQLLDLWALAGGRQATAFHLGYARTLLGLSLPEPNGEAAHRRWYTFGRLRGHDRRGERNWIAEMLQDPQVLVDLLSDPQLAGQVLPLVVRTLFWCGDLQLAVRAIQYLASEPSAELEMIIDAAFTDLLARLENRNAAEDHERTASILTTVLGMAGFERLPPDVRARYHKALAERLLLNSDWSGAERQLDQALQDSGALPRIRSAVCVLLALCKLRVHGPLDLLPQAQRPERQAALKHLSHVDKAPENATPDALFVRGLLAYETGAYEVAAASMHSAVNGLRANENRDLPMQDRARFFEAAALLCADKTDEQARALQLMEKALDTVKPDLETFYTVHEALKKLDRKLALRFLDAVDIGRGTSPDQLLFVALEYQSLGEAAPACAAARRVLDVATDLDQRIEALQVELTAHNMKGEREQAKNCYAEIRDLLLQRGGFEALEKLLKNEGLVGQALDHLEIKVELAALYEEMDGKDYERAQLQIAVARSLRARKEIEALQQAHGLLMEVECAYPDLAKDELQILEKLLSLEDAAPVSSDAGKRACSEVEKLLGHPLRVLVVGGNERQRRHHPRFVALGEQWGFTGEWLMTNYTSPQKVVNQIADRLAATDVMFLLHWNRHETTEPALELARKAEVPSRTVHYAGFTSLQVAMTEMLQKLVANRGAKAARA